MNCEVKYTYSEDKLVLIRTFIGTVYLKDVLDSWYFIFDNNLLTSKQLGVVSNYSEAIFEINVRNMYELKVFHEKHESWFSNIKLDQVITSPKIHAPVFYKGKFNAEFTGHFSNIYNAIEWVNS